MNFKNQKGQALVELAFSLMLLLTIVFGIFEFGRAMYITNTFHNAAREGARRASVSPTTPLNIDDLTAHVKSSIPFDAVEIDNVAVDITPSSPLHGISTITVTVTWPFKSVVPLIAQLDGIDLQGEASMLYE